MLTSSRNKDDDETIADEGDYVVVPCKKSNSPSLS